MARTLSQDLRDRVVAAIDGGLSCHAASARFGVSVSSAIRWRRRALEHGRAVARPRGGDRHSGKIEAHGGFIRELDTSKSRPSGIGYMESLHTNLVDTPAVHVAISRARSHAALYTDSRAKHTEALGLRDWMRREREVALE